MSQATLNGSCLCGAITYEATGEARRAYHCHCGRCRKATGTGHASNLFLQPATLRYVTGAELVRSFKLPQALRFTSVFCTQCGGRVAWQPPGSNIVLVPMGSLDCEPPLAPQARIHTGSRSSWSCGGDALPTFPENPPLQ